MIFAEAFAFRRDGLQPACWRCRYFVSDAEDQDYGECHRYPRVMVLYDSDDVCWEYPMMECLDWCGEFVEDKEDIYGSGGDCDKDRTRGN